MKFLRVFSEFSTSALSWYSQKSSEVQRIDIVSLHFTDEGTEAKKKIGLFKILKFLSKQRSQYWTKTSFSETLICQSVSLSHHSWH